MYKKIFKYSATISIALLVMGCGVKKKSIDGDKEDKRKTKIISIDMP